MKKLFKNIRRDVSSITSFLVDFLITLAGIPATTVLADTSLVTTAPAATTAFSPTVTPGKMVALAPIQAFFLISTGFSSNFFDDEDQADD